MLINFKILIINNNFIYNNSYYILYKLVINLYKYLEVLNTHD